MKKLLGVAIIVLTLSICGVAQATPFANWSLGGGNPYTGWADYNAWVGVGDPSSPLWSYQIMYVYDFTNPGAGSIDISGGSAYLWGNTWYLRVQDAWPGNDSYIQSFSIMPGDGNTYSASGVPIYIPDDSSYVHAYVNMPQSGLVPEPASLSLLGLGLVGLVFRRKKTS